MEMEEEKSHRGAALSSILHSTLKVNTLAWGFTAKEVVGNDSVNLIAVDSEPRQRPLRSSQPCPPSAVWCLHSISKYSPGMLFQELRSHGSLRFVFWSTFAECRVSVNHKMCVFCYMEAVEHQREFRLSFSRGDPRIWCFRGSHAQLKWG